MLLQIVLKNYVQKKAKEYQTAYPEKFIKEKDRLAKQKITQKKESIEQKLLKKYIYFEFTIVIFLLIIGRHSTYLVKDV